MEFLIIFHDNALIYYPNVFFAALFLLLSLIVIFALQVIMCVSELGLVSKIKNHKYGLGPQKVNIINDPIIVKEKLISGGIYWLEKIEVKIEKLIKKIGKEILIDEKN